VVGVIGGERGVVVGEEARVACRRVEARLLDIAQERLRAVVDRHPQRRIEAREQHARRAVPAVPEVAGQLLQAREALRQPRPDVEPIGRSGHGGREPTLRSLS
jgi:hypothetical protein